MPLAAAGGGKEHTMEGRINLGKRLCAWMLCAAMVMGFVPGLVMEASATGEKTVWEGSVPISWNTEVAPGTQFETPSGIFTGLAKDNVIRIYTTTTYDEPQYVVTYKKGDAWEWTDLDVTVAGGVISYTVADETIATEIAERGLVIRGQAYSITKITVTKVSVSTVVSLRQADKADGMLYDLRGIKVKGQPARGIYIRNGKKVVLR